MTKLLTERSSATIQHEGRKVFVEGIFLVSDKINKNGRLYPRPVLEHAIESIQDKIREKSLFGQLGHPKDATRQLDQTSHIIESLRRKDNCWYGRARIIDEGAGKVAKAIIEAGGRIGCSSRGIGSTKRNGNHELVLDDYKLITVNLVQDPSAPGAFCEAITESIQNSKLTVNESAIALRILSNIDPKLAAAQQKYGTDWDGTCGNMYLGHAGFPSVDDSRTQLQRWEDDKTKMIQAPIDLQDKIQLAANGLSPNEVSSYTQLHGSKDPLKRATLRKAMKEEKQEKAIRNWAVGLLTRIAKKKGVVLYEISKRHC